MLDVMTDDDAPGTDISLERESLAKDLQVALETLNERERKVLEMYFGLGGKEHSLEEISSMMDLTRERVRQIKEKSIRKLRDNASISLLTKYLG
jgi:RNA polymerase primary sigma factor